MNRTLTSIIAANLITLAAASLPAAEVPRLTGAVTRPVELTPAGLSGLARVGALAKVADERGDYRATVAVEGVTLRSLLERADVVKPVDDGFNRPLDTFLVVSGRDGRRAVLSWGEVMLGAGPAPLLADRLRLPVPHHHDPVPAEASGWLDAAARRAGVAAECAACHDGKERPRLQPPTGLCLVVPGDGFPARFVEDVVAVEVRQVGISVAKRQEGSSLLPARLVGPDGTSREITARALRPLARQTVRDAQIGLGRGYHGTHTLVGISLAELVRPLLRPGTRAGEAIVLVTARDGYRAVVSGGELFLSPLGDNVLLVEREDGERLAPSAGPLKVVVRSDFFVDRNVRSVAEICVLLPLAAPAK